MKEIKRKAKEEWGWANPKIENSYGKSLLVSIYDEFRYDKK